MPPKSHHQSSTKKRKVPTKKQIGNDYLSKKFYTTLCKQLDGGHFANAIKTCDKLLALDQHDKDAMQTKLFLLLQTDQYLLALSALDARESSDGAYERAYSLYRLQREIEADNVLKSLKASQPNDRGVLHLEAQLSYRQGDYQSAYDLYNQLLDTSDPQSEEHADILTNLQAAQKHLDFVTKDYLRSLDSLDNAITLTLESAPVPAQPGASAAITSPLVAVAPPPRDVPKKSVRMRRVPKGVVPGVTPAPDPERWLKKTERSTYQPPRGKRKGGGATQGVVETAGIAPAAGGQGKSGKNKKKK